MPTLGWIRTHRPSPPAHVRLPRLTRGGGSPGSSVPVPAVLRPRMLPVAAA